MRKNYVNKNGKVGVMIRITLNGGICQFSSKLEIAPQLWDTKTGKAAGKSIEASKFNALLDNMRMAIANHYREIERTEPTVTPEKIRNAFLGIKSRQEMNCPPKVDIAKIQKLYTVSGS